jgi:ABC-type transport system involved in multi-copper enzyme maturation permease subunit
MSKEWRIIASVAAVILCVHLLAYAELLLNADRHWPDTMNFLTTAQWVLFHILAVLPFGMEFQSGSMGRLLSQPMSRVHIWWKKVTPLVVFFTLIILLNILINIFLYVVLETPIFNNRTSGGIGSIPGAYMEWHQYSFLTMNCHFAVAAMVAICGGLCMSLYTRKLMVAFWAALLIPFLINMAHSIYFASLVPLDWLVNIRMQFIILVALLGIYAAATYTLAYRRFMRLEV